MAPGWQTPKDWEKEGVVISGVTGLKTGAWTSVLSAKETKDGRQTEIIIKTFCVPQDILDDPKRIAVEREKFLASARLQKQLVDQGARHWVEILRISDDPAATMFSMKKCGRSLQDLLDNKIFLSAKELYSIVLAIIDGFNEIMTKQHRAHGSLKASDVLASLPGQIPPYKLADPSPKSEDHSANDLYALGLIIYQLIEHKEWDPLTPIIPTRNWARFAGKRDRWIQFLNQLLSPNGCHDPLPEIRKEATRLKPGSTAKIAALGTIAAMLLAGAAFATLHFLPIFGGGGGKSGGGVIVGGGGGKGDGGSTGKTSTAPAIDPKARQAFDDARQIYQDLSTKWTALDRTQRYDHTKSRALDREARALAPDQVALVDSAAFLTSAEAYKKATAKLQEALDQEQAEETAGRAQDETALAEFQKAKGEFDQAKSAWEAAAAKFNAQHDHTRSTTLAQAVAPPPDSPPADAAGRLAMAEQFRGAANRLSQALSQAAQEEQAGLSNEQMQAAFNDARQKYQQTRTRWDSASAGATFDLSAENALIEQSRRQLPDQIVLTNAASYQSATAQYNAATTKLEQALALLEQAQKAGAQQKVDVTTAVTRANDALKNKNYTDAYSWYRKAADLGNAPAMYNVALLSETGQGTEKSAAEAVKWYRKAADLNHPAAMVNLALCYEKGRGVEQDYRQAIALYRKAADLKDTAAMRNLAYLYENGLGVDRDNAEALRWEKKAAELNDATAMYLVGMFYDKGKGVPIDYAQALAWYKKAGDLKNAAALNAIGVLYETGRGAKADAVQAIEWYKKAADLNFAPAMSNIGALYDNGVGVPLDHAEALKWFTKAAELHQGMAMFNLGVLYETGRGVMVDLPTALDWYRKAAKSDDTDARKLALGRLNSLGFPE